MPRARAEALSPGFTDTTVFSGLSYVTAVRFAPAGDSRVFIAQQDGRVYAFTSLTATVPTLVADLRPEVHFYWDRGLSGLAVDPQFPAKPFLYLLYAFNAPIGGTAPTWPNGCPTPPGPTTDGCVVSRRLSRITVDPSTNQMVPGSEKVLINDWCQQAPSHSVADLHFGPDGALFASAGSGAAWWFTDYGQGGGTLGTPPVTPANPCGDPPAGLGGTEAPPTAEGGSLRSQSFARPAGEPVSLDGSVIRVDPATGAAAADNPAASSSDSNRRRIVAYGLRNPYRFTFRPGTGEVWIGDVGENRWESIFRLASPTGPVQNFGWPCFEGPGPMLAYQQANLAQCDALYAAPAGTRTGPYFTYSHDASVLTGDGCTVADGSSITGIVFAPAGPYPPSYHNAMFFADHTRDCIWAMLPASDGLPDPSNIVPVASGAGHPVDLETGPDGAVYYADHGDGQVHRLGYRTPQASASATPANGPAPLSVAFLGDTSSDPDATAVLSYHWDFGDGSTADTADANHIYTRPGTYPARLTVTDQRGAADNSSVTITAGASPPTAHIDSPSPSLTWAVRDPIAFSGSASDPADGPLPPSAFTWSLIIHHCPTVGNCHIHHVQDFPGVSSGSFAAPDHGYPSFLTLQLTATDSYGLTDTASVDVQPRTVELSVQSQPAGLSLGLGDESVPAPFTRTVIARSTNSLSAPATQSTPSRTYTLRSWSDGGPAVHDIVATASAPDETLTAAYDPSPAPPAVTPGPTAIAPAPGLPLPPPPAPLSASPPATGLAPLQSSLGGAGPLVAPRISGLRFERSRFVVAPAVPARGSSRRSVRATGATVHFHLSEAAFVTLTFMRLEHTGRRSRAVPLDGLGSPGCTTGSHRPRGARGGHRCAHRSSDRLVTGGRTGSNSYRFSGWVGGAPLSPGRYLVAARAVDGGLALSPPQYVAFDVIAARPSLR